jgi:Ca-activated chloride channel family protein
VRREILASVKRSRFRFLRGGRGLMTVAAAALVVFGVAFALRVMDQGSLSERTLDTKVAREDAPEQTLEFRAGVEERFEDARNRQIAAAEGVSIDGEAEKLDGLGYGADSAEAPTASVAEAPTEESVALFDLKGLPGLESTEADSAAPSDGHDDAWFLGLDSSVQEQNVAPAAASPAPAETASTGQYGTSAPSAFVARRAASQSAPRGRGPSSPAFSQRSVPLLREPALPAGQSGGYRGAGDSVSPGGPKEEGLDALAGLYVGRVDTETQEQLQALGYVGDDGGEESAPQVSAVIDRVSQREAVELEQGRQKVQLANRQTDEALARCRLLPGESPADMFFRYWGDNPFVLTHDQALSTFAADVDTASYALARSYLNSGKLPPREAVRTEEFVNYFKADQPPPTGSEPFALGLELAPSLFASDARTEMLRVTVRGRDVANFERQPLALTLVIDNSGSMNEGNRLELVKSALRELWARSMPRFGRGRRLQRERARAHRAPLGRQPRVLEDQILAIPIEGGRTPRPGLVLGYELAARRPRAEHRQPRGALLDGVANVGETDQKRILETVQAQRARGIYLNTFGVGMGNHDDRFLEQLADAGDGQCSYLDSLEEAKRQLVDGLAQSFQPIARDVKVQVEFDRSQVESWRQLGYENRALRTEDFRDDKIDAGEVNAGHQVTVLYEIVRTSVEGGPLATVRLRYKPPFAVDRGDDSERQRAAAETALEIERSIRASRRCRASSRPRAATAARFSSRSSPRSYVRSVHARGDDFARLLEEVRSLSRETGDPEIVELVGLLEHANPLLDQRAKEETPKVQVLMDELARRAYESGQNERKREELEPEERARIEREVQRLEGELRVEMNRIHGVTPELLQELKDLGYSGAEQQGDFKPLGNGNGDKR